MRLIAKVIRISCDKFHCNRLTAVQDIQDYMYVTLILVHSVLLFICHLNTNLLLYPNPDICYFGQ